MNQFMYSSILILLVVFSFHGGIIVYAAGGGGAGDLVSDVCNKASTTNPSLSYDFCVSTLDEANPKNGTSTDIFGVGKITMELSLTKAAYLNSSTNIILKDGKTAPDVINCLVACSRYYTIAVSYVEDAISAFKSKDFISAGKQMFSAMEAAQDCEDGFQGGLISPLENDDKAFIQLSSISYTITGMN